MGIRGLKKWALLLTFWVALQTRWARATDGTFDNLTVNDSATITDDLNITSGSLQLGSWTSGGSTYPGFYLSYSDGTPSTSDFDAMRSGNIWRWQQNGYSSLKLQMKLDNSDVLTIYDTSGTAGITLNPGSTGTSTIAGSLTVSGTDNEMPSQTLVNANSVITEGLGDSRYVSSSAPTLALGSGSSATGTNAVALGFETTASGNYSFASGEYSIAGGNNSTAMGNSYASGRFSTAAGLGANATGSYSVALGYLTSASGYYSVALGAFTTASGSGCVATGWYASASDACSEAMGYYPTASGFSSVATGAYTTASSQYATAMGWHSSASGYASTAMGTHSTANGPGSTAMGGRSTASGYYSTATGYYTTATAYDSFAVGTYNLGKSESLGTANSTSWVAADPLFEVGNGTSTTPSDALVVYKDGNVKAGGVITAQPGGDIPMYAGE